MTPQEIEAISESQNANPYYVAYALATGCKTAKEAYERDGDNARFFSWNNRMWDETCKREGINRHYCSQFYQEHLITLSQHIR